MDLTALLDRQVILGLLVAIATMATIVTLAMPLLQTDTLARRMKSAATERDRIRTREREKLYDTNKKVNLRHEPKAFMKEIVDKFNLSKWLGTEEAKMQMTMAGFRGPQADIAFLFFRLITPIVFFAMATVYFFVLGGLGWPLILNIGAVISAAYLGIKAPELYLRNVIGKRQKSISRSAPDAMDLLLICVESGMSIEVAFRRVSQEVGSQSIPLAEELTLTTAELSYLPDRRMAYENLAKRTGVESLKQISTVLIQAERYGTPLATALRVVAQEGRDQRMAAAEKKAMSLPPKLTVPMIIFFLPVLFAVIVTPAAIQVNKAMSTQQ
jgi:tight adherence protein C